jgi:hypothetical protein
MDKNTNNLKIILIFIGFAAIFLFLTRYLESKSPLDILFITMGLMAIITGFYLKGEKIIETVTYFGVMSFINIFQWLIVIYILFISQIVITSYILIFLAIAPAMSIILINQIRRSNLKYLGNRQKTNKDVILIDKIKLILMDKTKVILIFVGIVIMLLCLASFLQSKSPLELFGTSVGIMVIVYGFYHNNKKNKTTPPDYSPGMSRSSIYRASKKVNITTNYFFIMSGVLIFQWLIFCYIAFIYQAYVPDEVYRSEVNGVPFAFSITMLATFFFYIQIRESDLKYIGRRKTNN